MNSMRITLACACIRPRPSANPLAIRTSHLFALAALSEGLLSPSPNLISVLILHESYSATFNYNLSLLCLALYSNELGLPLT